MVLHGIYKPDIGFDEISENERYTNIISNEKGDILCVVEGKNIEECEYKANLICSLINRYTFQ